MNARRIVARAAGVTAVGAALAMLATSDSEAIAAPESAKAGARDASTEAASPSACTMTMTGGVYSQLGCKVDRDFRTTNYQDAAVPISDVRIHAIVAAVGDPSVDVRIVFWGVPSVGPQYYGSGWTEVRVQEGGTLRTPEGGAVTTWAAKSLAQTMTLNVTSVQTTKVGGQLVSVIHGELDARLPVENVAITHAPPDVVLRVTF